MQDAKTDANLKLLKEIIEAAENSNAAGERAANIAARGLDMLRLLKTLKVEVAGAVRYGNMHVSLLNLIQAEIDLAEHGYVKTPALADDSRVQRGLARH